MGLTLKSEPAVEPLSLEEAKLHLRVDGTDEDSLITFLIGTARHDVETITRRALITQTWELVMDDWPDDDWFPVPMPKLQSILSIKYKDENGVEYTFDPENYAVDTDSVVGRVMLFDDADWPSDELYPVSAIRVEFTAGYGDTGSDVPAPIRQAMKLLIGHYYENREAVINSTGANIQLLPMGVSALLQTYRVWGF